MINAFAVPNEGRNEHTVNGVDALAACASGCGSRSARRTGRSTAPRSRAGQPERDRPRPRAVRGRRCQECHGGTTGPRASRTSTRRPIRTSFRRDRPERAGRRPNPIGTQYLDRFLEDIGSFNIGVRGEGNRLGRNIGAAEFANAAPNAQGELALPDALGFDHDEDGAGDGYNVPSLLGIYALPPYLHNGACETLLCVLTDVEHRTAGNETDVLNTRTKRNRVAKFLELIDLETVRSRLRPSERRQTGATPRRGRAGVLPALPPLPAGGLAVRSAPQQGERAT